MKAGAIRVPPRDVETMLCAGVYLLSETVGVPSGYEVLYAPLTNGIVALTTSQALLLRESLSNPRHLESLLEHLLGPLRKEFPPAPHSDFTYRPVSVALMLTTACQLRCSYCYANAGRTRAQHLDVSTAKAAIDLIANNAATNPDRRFRVYFHGAGEPSLRMHQLREMLSYAREVARQRNLRLVTGMTTNFCVEDETALWLANELDEIFVSCDGPPDIMRQQRPMVLGDSGGVLDHALRAVSSAGLQQKLWLRATITRDIQHRLIEIVEYAASLGVAGIYLAPVAQVGRGVDISCIDKDAYVLAWYKAQQRADELGIKLASPVVNLDRLRPSGFLCGIGGGGFAILPDGAVSLCWEAMTEGSSSFIVGKLEKRLDVDIDRIRHIRKEYHVSRRSACHTCFCRMTCAGRCAARDLGGDPASPRDAEMNDACDVIRFTTLAEIGRRLTDKGEMYV